MFNETKNCGECGAEFVGKGFPIANISDPNCGQCYGHVNGVYQSTDTTHNEHSKDKADEKINANDATDGAVQ